MMELRRWKDAILGLYGPETIVLEKQTQRWGSLIDDFRHRFGAGDLRLFTAPGRTEIGGNHTDHNYGKVLAAGVDLDSIAAASTSGDGRIVIFSQGYPERFEVSLDALSVVPAERGTTAALIRGIAARFRQHGFLIGGFRACIASDVPVGSGLSSSASIEVLIATVLNALYNSSKIDPVTIASVGQYAENVYFGKPCGLMDQITSAVGGVVKIDFEDPLAPAVEKVDFDFSASGVVPLVVDTGGSHADLTEDYSSIPREMMSVAAFFGKTVCRQIYLEELLSRLAELRAAAGDRAILRALHFLQENRRVDLQVEALRNNDMAEFLRLVRESGDSSYRWLQNCVSPHAGTEQGIPLALALAERFVRDGAGACRVHGGGFAGTILAFLPAVCLGDFQAVMESAFGPGCVKRLRIRTQGSMEIVVS